LLLFVRVHLNMNFLTGWRITTRNSALSLKIYGAMAACGASPACRVLKHGDQRALFVSVRAAHALSTFSTFYNFETKNVPAAVAGKEM